MPGPSSVGSQRAHAAQLGLAALILCMTACSPRLDWRELKSPDGYTVMLPGRAQVVARDIDFEGHKLAVSMTSTGVGATMFAVGAVTLPPGLADDAAARERVIAYFRDGLLKNIGATVTEAEIARLSRAPAAPQQLRAAQGLQARGHAGRDGAAARLAARWFIVDDRLYQLTALGGDEAIEPEALATFFDSFSPAPDAAPRPSPASGVK